MGNPLRYYKLSLCLLLVGGCCFPAFAADELETSVYSQEHSFSLKTAITKTLELEKSIQISVWNVEDSRGVLQESAGPFDTRLDADAAYDLARGRENLSAGVASTSTNGVPSPAPDYISLDDHLWMTDTALNKKTRVGTTFFFSAQSLKEQHMSPSVLITFQVEQPLLRNFMYGIDTQTEKANRLELTAVKWDTLNFISLRILETVYRYWDVVAAEKMLVIQQEAEARLERLVAQTRSLIQGSQLAASDIEQPLARLAVQRGNRIAAEQDLYAAKELLLLAMGEINEESPTSVRAHALRLNMDFPLHLYSGDSIQKSSEDLIHHAFHTRFDILAAELRESKASTLVKGARNQTLPEVNIFGNINKKNNVAGTSLPNDPFYNLSTFGIVPGAYEHDWMVGVRLSIPFHNDEAIGFERQQVAMRYQNILQTQLLKQTTVSSILQSINNQILLELQLQTAREAVKKYEEIVRNETEKLNAGYSTVFVLVDFEERLTSAETTLLSINNMLLKNLAVLRYQTGTLLLVDSPDGRISVNDVTTYPFLCQKR